jgi:hypothetical protein
MSEEKRNTGDKPPTRRNKGRKRRGKTSHVLSKSAGVRYASSHCWYIGHSWTCHFGTVGSLKRIFVKTVVIEIEAENGLGQSYSRLRGSRDRRKRLWEARS